MPAIMKTKTKTKIHPAAKLPAITGSTLASGKKSIRNKHWSMTDLIFAVYNNSNYNISPFSVFGVVLALVIES